MRVPEEDERMDSAVDGVVALAAYASDDDFERCVSLEATTTIEVPENERMEGMEDIGFVGVPRRVEPLEEGEVGDDANEDEGRHAYENDHTPAYEDEDRTLRA